VPAADTAPQSTDVPQQDLGASVPRAEGEAGQEERRERRSRDRYGRDRRERSERPQNEAASADSNAPSDAEGTAPAPRPQRERRERFHQEERAVDNRATEQAPAAAPAVPARTGMPRIGSYELPVQSLSDLAHSASMEWVQSNAERVAAVQAAIAAEPKPVHVPRERPAPVVLDEGPLILVETRKDLAQLNMPFEAQKA
jgi:ribonuclease E